MLLIVVRLEFVVNCKKPAVHSRRAVRSEITILLCNTKPTKQDISLKFLQTVLIWSDVKFHFEFYCWGIILRANKQGRSYFVAGMITIQYVSYYDSHFENEETPELSLSIQRGFGRLFWASWRIPTSDPECPTKEGSIRRVLNK